MGQGVLAHSTSTLLLGQHTACQEDSTLILELYPVVRDLCSNPSTFSFHCFSLLRQWSSRLADICFQVSAQTNNTFSVQVPMDTVKDVLSLCSQNLDNSTKGIS